MAAMYQEQRKKPRYGSAHENLSVRVKRTRGILRSVCRPLTATCIDFNCYGMSYESMTQQRVGEQVLLDLSLGDKCVTNVVALVCNARPSKFGRYRHGVLFDFRANEHMRSRDVESAIECIEADLRDTLSKNTVRQ